MWWRSPIFIGVVVALIVRIALGVALGPKVCNDGWESPSIGKRGACSWHGGVDRRAWVAWVSILAGLGAGVSARRLQNRQGGDLDKPGTRRPEGTPAATFQASDDPARPAAPSIYNSTRLAGEAGMSLRLWCDACRHPTTVGPSELRGIGDFNFATERENFRCQCGGAMRPIRLMEGSRPKD